MSIITDNAQGQRFGTVRKDGYDTDEVDQYVEHLERRVQELEMKRSVLEEANSLLHEQLLRLQEQVREAEAENTQLLADFEEAMAEAGPAAAPQPVEPAAPADDSPSYAVARLLEIATRDADELVEVARAQAGEMLESARSEADEVVGSARGEAQQVVGSAREEADRVRMDLDRLRSEVESRIAELTEHESRNRAHLVAWHRDQLSALGDLAAMAQDEARDESHEEARYEVSYEDDHDDYGSGREADDVA